MPESAPAKTLHICEVGPRDGLQNEKRNISTAEKIGLVDSLVDAGLSCIELSSFVSPKAVPQMSDAEELVKHVRKYDSINFPCLVFNEKGYERARSVQTKALAFIISCTETFSQKNSRMSIAEALSVFQNLMQRARVDGLWTRIYLSVAWFCPYEGEVDLQRVLKILDQVAEEGCDEVAIADTVGHATPDKVGELFRLAQSIVPITSLAAHLHDTTALGLANCYASLQAGVRIIDSSIGGLGGCPFAPGAAGNLATEDLVFMAQKMGFETGVNLDKLWKVVDSLEPLVGRAVGGRTASIRKCGPENPTTTPV